MLDRLVAPVMSVTFSVTVLPLAPVGVPEISPAVEIVRPAGRFVPVVVHV